MLNEKELKKALDALHKDDSRKFKQSYDFILALKDINLKNPEEQVEFFASVHKTTGKKSIVCGLVGPEMVDDAKKVFDHVVSVSDFDKLGKKEMKKLAAECHFFVGQANVMPKIAGAWGKVLGPRGKMPNPKAGCIVPPKAPLAPLYARLQKMIKVSVKKSPSIQVLIGTQEMSPEDVLDNIKTIYDQIIHHLPKEENNVKAVMVKLTMSKPIKIR